MDKTTKTKEVISSILEKEFGITYEDYIHLDIYKQQEIMKILRSRKPRKKDNKELIMIGYGEYSLVTKVKKGTKVMTRYGNMVEAGLTQEESEARLNKRIEEAIEGKPKSKILSLFKKKSR